MSAKRSQASILVKKFGKMAEQYQARIDRQAETITRLTDALMTYGDALTEISQEVPNVKKAREVAKAALAKAQEVLAVNKEED